MSVGDCVLTDMSDAGACSSVQQSCTLSARKCSTRSLRLPASWH